MAKHASLNVGTSAAKLNFGGAEGNQVFAGRRVVLQPAAAISIGGPGVTVAAGIVLAAGSTTVIEFTGDLWAIGAAATTVKVLS